MYYIESRIEFPDPMLMTFDKTKFLKNCPKNAEKLRMAINFPPLWFLILKLNHNSGLNAKNQREICKNKVRRPPLPPLYGNVVIPLYFNL